MLFHFSSVLPTIFFPSHRQLFHVTTVEIMESGEGGMIPMAMTIINPQKEYWLSLGIEPVTSCSQVLYATD